VATGNGNGKYEFIQRNCHEVSNAMSTLVAREKPGFQALSKGLTVLLCAEVVRRGVPDHGALHSEGCGLKISCQPTLLSRTRGRATEKHFLTVAQQSVCEISPEGGRSHFFG